MLKHKVGDVVKMRRLKDLSCNYYREFDNIRLNEYLPYYSRGMFIYAGQKFCIEKISAMDKYYLLGGYFICDEFLEEGEDDG